VSGGEKEFKINDRVFGFFLRVEFRQFSRSSVGSSSIIIFEIFGVIKTNSAVRKPSPAPFR
jgi:hypothetical protein